MNAAGIDLDQLKIQNFGEGAETELVLTALRACWLWNAAGIDLNQLKTAIVSNTSLCLTAKAANVFKAANGYD